MKSSEKAKKKSFAHGNKMPGENCCVVGCGSNRRMKGLGIFKLPSKNLYKEWREKWLNEITKYRVIDKSFKAQIEKDNVYTCERHFHPDEIEICKCIL